MKYLPIGEYDFKTIRVKDLLYVDKTQYLYELILAGKYYFLARPRRFGKSLLISTLSYLFSAKKELFEGLWVYDKVEWKEHPIIHLSFNNLDYHQRGLEKALQVELNRQANKHHIVLQKNTGKGKLL